MRGPTLRGHPNFRQVGSPAPGHPENFELAGVEATTGPLGQGLAMAVGMAMAERHLNADASATTLVDHRTWVIAGDGCLDGRHQSRGDRASPAISGLGQLIVLWDDNKITIDGAVDPARRARTSRRATAATGWHVVELRRP